MTTVSHHPSRTGQATAKATTLAQARAAALRWTLAAATLAALAALATPRAAAAQNACGGFYTMDDGDNLYDVAQLCGITLPALLAANPGIRDREDFQAGTRLRIPDPGDAQPSPIEACGPFYTVRTSDTLAEIAQKCGLTVPLLVAANAPLPDPLGNQPGLRIRIPPLPAAAVRDPRTLVVAPMPDTIRPAGDTTAAPAPELTRIEGVLEEGPRCLRIRTTDGRLIAIAGRMNESFGPGDRVVLMGNATSASACQHDPTLELRIVYRPGG